MGESALFCTSRLLGFHQTVSKKWLFQIRSFVACLGFHPLRCSTFQTTSDSRNVIAQSCVKTATFTHFWSLPSFTNRRVKN